MARFGVVVSLLRSACSGSERFFFPARVSPLKLRVFPIVVAICAVLGLPLGVSAQVANPDDTIQRPIPDVGHDLIDLLVETVNPADGSVNLNFNLPTPKSRGTTLPFSLTYNSGALFHFTAYTPGVGQFVANSPFFSGWGTSLPYITFTNSAIIVPYYSSICYFSTGYEFYDLKGTGHSLQMASLSPESLYNGPGCNNMGSGLDTFQPVYSGGDSQVNATFTETCGWGPYGTGQGTECNYALPPVKVIDGAGNIYSFNFWGPNGNTNQIGVSDIGGTGGGSIPASAANFPTSIEDRNGNLITFLRENATSVTDTAGRALVTIDNIISPKTITAGGLTYTLAYPSSPPKFGYSIPTYSLLPPGGNPNPQGTTCGFSSTNVSGTSNFPNKLSLPNSKSYGFTYDPTYGVLTEITYPDGGWVKYTWGLPTLSGESRYNTNALFDAQNQNQTYDDTCNFLYQTPVVTQRQVGFGGSNNPILTQTFTYSTTWNSPTSEYNNQWNTKTTTIVTTDNATQRTSKTVYTYSPVNTLPPPGFSGGGIIWGQIPVEHTVQYYDWGQTNILRTDTKTWYDQFNLQTQQTTIGSQTSGASYTYGFGGAVTQQNEYDFGGGGPGALLRQSVTTYQAFPANPLISLTGGLYSISTLLTSPCRTIVYDGNGTRYAETDYFYDNSATASSCPSTVGSPSVSAVTPALLGGTHDETNYGTSSTISRGNVTQQTRWLSGGSPITTYTYDETGQVLSVTDPCGNGTCSDMTGSTHTTNYIYTDSYSIGAPTGNTNTYLTKVTDPLGHLSNFMYSYSDGHLTSATDANSQVSNYKYNTPPSGCSFTDGLDRLSEIDYPDGGKTTYCYNDSTYSSTPSPSVTTTNEITSSLSEVSVIAFDGMGHTVETILSSDPDNPTYTATTYDGLGHSYQVSNPYRTMGDSTYGFATHLVDGIGRTCLVVPPDFAASAPTSCPGSATTGETFTSYNGNQTTVTDEVGNQRTTQMDGLGRLTDVWEAPNNSNYNYHTVYGYNALNDLQSVSESGSRGRSFSYDSLSRLTSSANPESGTISYAYDPNGNLSTKTAPLPNAPSTPVQTVTTNYTYDVLNRITGKTYTGTTMPNISFGYDGTSLACAPGLSDPYGIGRRTAMCDGSGATSWSHDQMGRIAAKKQLQSGAGISITKQTSYVYNLDGSLYTVNYPSPNLLTYTVGGAGRVTQVSDGANSYVGYSGNPATYTPNGAVAGMINGHTGSFAGIVSTNAYNDRLQPILLSASVGQNSIFTFCYDFHLGVQVNTTPCPVINANATGDNDNVFQITNGRDTSRTVAFAYDPLNRIAQANTTTTTGSNCWGEVYNIDAWGNLVGISPPSGMSGSCSTEQPSIPVNGNNQIIGYCYDGPGNLLDIGGCGLVVHSFVYDAEGQLQSPPAVGVGNGTLAYTYFYDGDGNRVQKCNANPCTSAGSSGTLYWEGPGGEVLDESDRSGSMQEEYVYFNGERIARRDVSSNNVHYYFSNHLGSASVITDNLGNVQQQTDYYPFGGISYNSGTDSNRYKFTGKERDAESGLDYFGARYMSSSMGRFMSPDPMLNSGRPDDPQTWNRYSYALNNPLTVTDPTGMYNLVNNCAADNKQCNSDFNNSAKNLKNGLADLTSAVNGMKDGDQKTALQGALKAFGTENDGNNVGVQFGKNADGAAGNTQPGVDASGGLKFTVTFDPSMNKGTVNQAINAAHEGQHVEDVSDPRFASDATTLSYFSQEYRAYRTSAYAASALGQSSISYGKNGQYPIWNGSWGAVDKNLTRYIPTLDKPGHTDHQETTPHDPWSPK